MPVLVVPQCPIQLVVEDSGYNGTYDWAIELGTSCQSGCRTIGNILGCLPIFRKHSALVIAVTLEGVFFLLTMYVSHLDDE